MSAEPDSVLPVPVEEGEIVAARPAGAGLEQSRRGSLPAVQAAAAAAGGFVAGAAMVRLVNRRHARGPARGRRAGRLRGRGSARNASLADRLQIVGSRSLLLDIHLLGSPGER